MMGRMNEEEARAQGLSLEDLRQQRNRAARKSHPDVGGDNRSQRVVNKVYAAFRHRVRRVMGEGGPIERAGATRPIALLGSGQEGQPVGMGEITGYEKVGNRVRAVRGGESLPPPKLDKTS